LKLWANIAILISSQCLKYTRSCQAGITIKLEL
jgi:hypothetical protein